MKAYLIYKNDGMFDSELVEIFLDKDKADNRLDKLNEDILDENKGEYDEWGLVRGIVYILVEREVNE